MSEQKEGLFGFQWHITNRCNLRCAHCYQDNYLRSGELELDRLKCIADDIVQTLAIWSKKGDIAITGGEPLLRDDVFELIEYLMSFEEIASVDLLTNGTLINVDIAAKLARMKKLRCVQISLDGASAKCHDTIRGKGSFDKSLSAIRLLRMNKIRVNVMFTLQRCNLADVGSIIDLSINEDVGFLTIERFVPRGSGSKTPDQVLSREEIGAAFNYINSRAEQQIMEKGRSVITRARPLWALCDGVHHSDGCKDTSVIGGICSVGLDGLCILPDGTVLPCRRYASAGSNATNPILFEPMVMSILLSQQVKICRLEKALDAIKRQP